MHARSHDAEVEPVAGTTNLAGSLTLPAGAPGLVIFAHGSGSSRHNPRNRYVADVLADAGLGTLLFDLLTPDEEADRANVFDIGLLAGRLSQVTAWLRDQGGSEPIGYFGASTGAAAALWAATDPGADIAAVVSRGGRPDLAGARLAAVTAPTLLIVGGDDAAVLDLNRHALAELRCDKDLAVVDGAMRLFEEPGTLTAAAALARDWFLRYLGTASSAGRVNRPGKLTDIPLRQVTGQVGLADHPDNPIILNDRQALDLVLFQLLEHGADVCTRGDGHGRSLCQFTGGGQSRVGTLGETLSHNVPISDDPVQTVIVSADRKRAYIQVSHELSRMLQALVLADALGADMHDVSRCGHDSPPELSSGGSPARTRSRCPYSGDCQGSETCEANLPSPALSGSGAWGRYRP